MKGKGKNLICENNIVDAVKDYSPNQIKLFYGMLYKFKEEIKYGQCENEEIFEMDLNEIKNITKDSKLSQDRIFDIVNDMPIEIKFSNKDKLLRVSAFEFIQYDFEYETLTFKVTDTFGNILSQVLEKYTIIQLQEITKLTSKYSIRLYELMRRYIKQQYYMMKLEDFKEYFDVPASYKMCNIDYKILKPASKEIKSKLGIECTFTKKKRGRNITHILFEFKEE